MSYFDIQMTDSDLDRIINMTYKRSGIVIDRTKKEMVYSRLARRLRLHGMTDFTSYIDKLESQPNAREWESFINSMTTNMTAFFRESHHFPIIAEHVKKLNRPAKIWCAAASTGEEPYSIAMTLVEALGLSKASQCRILATDIDTQALSKAESGIYPIDQVKKLSVERARNYFLKGVNSNANFARINKNTIPSIEFRKFNLVDNIWDIDESFDIIMCRNIMIYFDKETQRQILDKISPVLSKDGILITGHSENFQFISNKFRLIKHTVYEHNK